MAVVKVMYLAADIPVPGWSADFDARVADPLERGKADER